MKVKIKKLFPDAIIPSYAHEGDAGLDFYSMEEVEIKPGERKLIGTGVSIELPAGYVPLIWDKSGLAVKEGLTTLGGVIEYTYRGEYKVILLNTSDKPYTVQKEQKIAQLLIQPIETAEIEEVEELSDSPRGENAFGSSGTH